jgi:thiol:disulfide interchange protein DsbA
MAIFMLLTPALARAQSVDQSANPPEEAAKADPSVEVIYFIYYGNFDCQVIEPKLESFIKNLPENVHFEVLPVVVVRGAVGEDEFYTVNQYADLFFVLDYFGQKKLLRDKIFQTVMDTLANTGEFALTDINYQMDFLDDYDLSMNEYREAIDSDKVDKQIEKALDYIQKFNIFSVPSMVVNGKTLVSYNPDKGVDNFFVSVNEAIKNAANPPKTKVKPRTVSKDNK